MKQSEHEIVNNVRKLLDDRKIALFIGYQRGTLPLCASPSFVVESNDASSLIWNGFCGCNLAVFLRSLPALKDQSSSARIGILCKGCDNRSIVELIKEKQIDRSKLFIIGISCDGIIDRNKIIVHASEGDIIEAIDNGEILTIRTSSGEQVLKRREVLCDSCLQCKYPTPSEYDVLIRAGEHKAAPATSESTQQFAAMPRGERWRKFEDEISKCIRCYACRNACPGCYCKECFAEQTRPRWFGTTSELSDLMFYHIVRMFHQAGRCVDCGACVRACPMNVDLRLFSRMLVDEVTERYGYEPGVSLKDIPPLAMFQVDDKQEFMTEPD